MKKFLVYPIIMLFALSAVLCGAETVDNAVKRSITALITNAQIVAPGVIRGGEPRINDLRILKKEYNIKTVLSLRNEEFMVQSERRVVEKLGMRFVNIPMIASEKQSPETIDKCLELIKDPGNHPVFFHCKSGKDRTGLIAAAYRIKYDGWPLQDAIDEWRAYGFNHKRYPKLEESLVEWYNARIKA